MGGEDHKDRIIAQLKQEAADLRQKERDYKNLQDQLLQLEQTFARVNDEKRKMDDDNKARVETNLVFIANLRNEIDEQKGSLNEKKQHNSDLYLELDR